MRKKIRAKYRRKSLEITAKLINRMQRSAKIVVFGVRETAFRDQAATIETKWPRRFDRKSKLRNSRVRHDISHDTVVSLSIPAVSTRISHDIRSMKLIKRDRGLRDSAIVGA